ncbi:SDR family oxidoreductase [Pectinatus frisingensis]|uniref:SDR family oxidoreductase n=1 Tax=Pectinatus frisingensis TaxID=865 RepID=UPI0018C83C8B|nr:SDR family oxidoreductase [Pectinatus frisingensis]
MKSIVTGGCGFIGSHIVDRLLDEGNEVIVIDNCSTGRLENLAHHKDNKNLQIVETDICNYEKIAPLFKEVDWVFHMAALADIVPSIQKPQEYFHSNVNGTFSVLQAARAANVKRFMYTASSSCYGIPDKFPTDEKADIRPEYPYALTKRLGEELALHWAQVYKLPVVSLCLFNVYGPRSRTSGTYGAVFGVFLGQKLAGKPYTIVGDGEQTRDFTYVADIVDAFMAAAKSDITGERFNVGSEHTYSVNRLVELLGGEKANIVYIPKRPGEPSCTWADTAKISKILNWHPKVTLEEGVQHILENIEYWKKAPVWTPKTIENATVDWFKYLGK